ncbi:MAG: SsrA-binding protein SmpB [Candidatus Omnitrophica bacterium]|nr:SsrA-binding protein SmpB [Candidatus Omnitrophota bacterium]
MKKMKRKTPISAHTLAKEGPAVTTNREARRDYFVLETLEAGIILAGCEVKSLREGNASLAGSFARLEKEAVHLHNFYVAPYLMGNRENPDPLRVKKLLLHKSQIHKLRVKTAEKGLALIPLRVYFNDHGIAKVELAVARGKNATDKRSEIKKESAKREIDRAIKNKNRRQ